MFKFFKNKKNTIKVKCYTANKGGIHYAYPPQIVSQPSWAKNLKGASPLEVARNMVEKTEPRTFRTIQTCPGRFELYKKGFIIPLWSDLYIQVNEKGEWRYQFSDLESKIDEHHWVQYSSLCKEGEFSHLKIISPWILDSPDDIDFIAIKPAWEIKALHGLEILPGILNFYHQHSMNVNLFIKNSKEKKQEFFLKAGTPLYHVIPLTDRRVELEVKAMANTDPDFINALKQPRLSFSSRNYRQHLKGKK
ncbi:MAG: hypothetical protein ACO2YY_09085 [Pseudohongiellaceae bacterium]